jgi:hypothetical protein
MDSLARGLRATGRWPGGPFSLLARVALVAGMALTLTADRDALQAVDWTIEPLALAAAIALLAAAPLVQALTLRTLRRLGADVPPVATLRFGRARSCCATSPAARLASSVASASASASAGRRRRS